VFIDVTPANEDRNVEQKPTSLRQLHLNSASRATGRRAPTALPSGNVVGCRRRVPRLAGVAPDWSAHCGSGIGDRIARIKCLTSWPQELGERR
jgi:hypothetical protein